MPGQGFEQNHRPDDHRPDGHLIIDQREKGRSRPFDQHRQEDCRCGRREQRQIENAGKCWQAGGLRQSFKQQGRRDQHDRSQ